MELKKSPKADLENKKSIFLLLGIAVSLGLMIGLFSWSMSEKKIVEMAAVEAVVEEELTEITIQEDTPPPAEAPKAAVAMSDIMQIVKNDTKIDQEITFLDESDLTAGPIEVTQFEKPKAEEVIDDDVPQVIVDKMPRFQGSEDLNVFRSWVQKDLEYPQMAQENGIQGTIILKFVVERDGKVSNIQVLRGVDRELDAAAVKKVQSSPKWTPGENRGKPARVTYTMQVKFVLQ